MLYHYVAANKEGRVVEADYDAADVPGVLRYLAGQELKPISVKERRATRFTFSRLFGRITIDDKVFLTKYLALMLRVGTDLLSAINILISDFDKPIVRNFLLEVRENLTRGQPFYIAFEGHPEAFSPTFINLIRAAETSGNLQQTFEDLSESLVKEADLRSRIRSAFIYPIVLLTMSLAILVFLVTFALPRIAGVFADSGIEPPFFSRLVFSVGLFAGNNIIILLAIIFGITTLVLSLTTIYWRGTALIARDMYRTALGAYKETDRKYVDLLNENRDKAMHNVEMLQEYSDRVDALEDHYASQDYVCPDCGCIAIPEEEF